MFIHKHPDLAKAYDTLWLYLKREPGICVGDARGALHKLTNAIEILEMVQGDNLFVEPPILCGQHIDIAAEEMVSLAKEYGLRVQFDFNNIILSATADTDPIEVVKAYWEGRRQRDAKAT